ncbi:MAG: hypothetical protein U0736_24520 [Gemmataceae bacterium]
MSLLLTVALVCGLTAGQTPDPRDVVERGIAAAGGAERLAKLQAATWKTAGTFFGRPAGGQLHGQLPDKFRLDSHTVEDGKRVPLARILNGESGWVVKGGKVEKMTPAEVAATRDTFHHKHVAQTLLPLRGAEYTLKWVGENQADGQTFRIVEASRAGHPPIRLFFDRKTGLLLKSTSTSRDREGRNVPMEMQFSDYRDVDGLKIAGRTRTYRDGKLLGDLRLTEFRPVRQLPDSLFLP